MKDKELKNTTYLDYLNSKIAKVLEKTTIQILVNEYCYQIKRYLEHFGLLLHVHQKDQRSPSLQLND